MSPSRVTASFHFELLKRDYLRLVNGMGYVNNHDDPFEPEHYDGGDLLALNASEDAGGLPLSSRCAISWTEPIYQETALDAVEGNLVELATRHRVAPTIENMTTLPDTEAAIMDPWLRFNEVEFVPFYGWYEGPNGVFCFASYNFQLAIAASSSDDPLMPLDDPAHSAPGQTYLELLGKAQTCLEFFHENCPMAALLPHNEFEDSWEFDPEEPIRTTLGRSTNVWRDDGKSVEFDYVVDDRAAVFEEGEYVPSAKIADETYSRWIAAKKKQSKKSGRRRGGKSRSRR